MRVMFLGDAMAWTVAFHDAAKHEAAAQPADVRARLQRFVEIIEVHGLASLPPKAVKHLQGDLSELRLTGRDGIARALYLLRSKQRLVIVHVFTKKTQKTPPQAMKLALKRAEEIQ